MDLASLPDEVKELVRAQLEAGHFQSVDEVVCEALRLLHEREELFASQREVLRSQIAEGVAAEERGELRDGAEAVADVRRRIDERLRRGRVTSLRFELTAPAERDLEEIFFEVKERHGLLVAERVYDNLLRTFELLADMPEMGRHRPDLWPAPYRFWPTGPAYVAYRSDVRPIRIVRIARASRDWSRFVPR